MPSASLRLSFALTDIHEAARRCWQWAHPARVFTFSGSLGAGKTTFIHALCDTLGVADVVSSPTFALINEYRFLTAAGEAQIIYHMDWYRLRDADEAVDAGMEEALHSTAYCFVEWPEKAPAILPGDYVAIHLEATDDTQRTLTATTHSSSMPGS